MKKVYFISRLFAEKITPEVNHLVAIISINSTDDLANLHENWKHKLFLVFADLVEPIEGFILFSEEQAKQVISFVDSIEKEINTLVVHCDAGVSRSAAIAKFVAEKYKIPIKNIEGSDNCSLYNKHVYNLLKWADTGIIPCTTEEVRKYNSRIQFT